MKSSLYFLDSDTINYAFNYRNSELQHRILSIPLTNIAISSITCEEMIGEAIARLNTARSHKHTNITHWHNLLIEVMGYFKPFNIISYPNEAEETFYRFQKSTRLVGVFDCRLAIHANLVGATVVTNNERDFEKIRMQENLNDLKIENWTK